MLQSTEFTPHELEEVFYGLQFLAPRLSSLPAETPEEWYVVKLTNCICNLVHLKLSVFHMYENVFHVFENIYCVKIFLTKLIMLLWYNQYFIGLNSLYSLSRTEMAKNTATFLRTVHTLRVSWNFLYNNTHRNWFFFPSIRRSILLQWIMMYQLIWYQSSVSYRCQLNTF